MAKPKLTYFDFPASRGEECRLALYIAGVDFDDNRISGNDWPALKPTTPFGSLPVFEIEGKPPLSQSVAILSYIGRKYGLLPVADEWECSRLESLLCATEDARHAVTKTFGIKDESELKKARAELAEGPIKTWAANIDKQIVGPFAGGEQLTVADLKIYMVAKWLSGGKLDHVPTNVLDGFAKLNRLCGRVKEHPKVVEWYSRR